MLNILVSFIFVTVFPISTVTILYDIPRCAGFPKSSKDISPEVYSETMHFCDFPQRYRFLELFRSAGWRLNVAQRQAPPPTLVHHEYYTVSSW